MHTYYKIGDYIQYNDTDNRLFIGRICNTKKLLIEYDPRYMHEYSFGIKLIGNHSHWAGYKDLWWVITEEKITKNLSKLVINDTIHEDLNILNRLI